MGASGSRARDEQAATAAAAAAAAAAAQRKMITVRNVRTVPMFEPSMEAASFFFETPRGQRVCWRIGQQAPAVFLSAHRVAGASDRFFVTPVVQIYFPVSQEYYVVKDVRCRNVASLGRILDAIESTAAGAVAYYVRRDQKRQGPITMADVRTALRGSTVCHLLLETTRQGTNRVFVRLSGPVA